MPRSHRQHARYAYKAEVAIHTQSEVLIGSTVNLSRGGLCAELDAPVAPKSGVAVDIQLVFEDERQSEPLRLPGRVTWCTPFNKRYQVGLSFRRLDAECSVYLMMFLRYLDPGKVREPSGRIMTIDERFG